MVAGRLGRLRAGAVLAGAMMCLWLSAGTASAALPLGGLAQLRGTAGCFTSDGNSEDGAGTCSRGRGIAEAISAEVSADGANVYVDSFGNPPLKPGIAVFSRDRATGALTQLAGTTGCITTDGSSSSGPGTCATARGFISAPGDGHDFAFTSDGRWVYAVAQNAPPRSAVLIFKRDPATGALTQQPGAAGCITADGSSQDGAGTCQTDATLIKASGISISSDDRFLYVIDYGTPPRIHVYFRDTVSGALTPVQCLSEAPAGAGCDSGRVLGNSEEVALSPDGTHAYSGDYQIGLSVFDRNPGTGVLTQKAGPDGCLSNDGKDDTGASTCTTARVTHSAHPILISPNGGTLYTTSTGLGFAVFHVNPDGTLTQLPGIAGCTTADGKDNTGASTCTTGRAISLPYGGVISPDGRSLYFSQNDVPPGGVAAFSLDPAGGIAQQLQGLNGCIISGGLAGACTDGTALGDAYGMSISPDGRFVYQASNADTFAGLAIFKRETGPSCNAASATTSFGAAVSVSLKCADPDGDPVTLAIVGKPAHGALSAIHAANGTVTYTPAIGFRGADSFIFSASDGVNTSASQTATVTVGAFGGAALSSTKLTLDGHGNVSLKLRCPRMAAGRSCRSVVDLFSQTGRLPATATAAAKRKLVKATLLGRGRFTIAAGKTLRARIHLGKAGRTLAAKAHRTLRARLLLTSTAGAGARRTLRYGVTIKLPRTPKKKRK
jgi:6-phosphogluconolactonase (cycloisomerase 2 family)